MFKQLDIVQILTTRGIKYLSGPEGHATSPQGNWSIVGFVGSEAVLSKENTLVKVPLTDIKKVASYSVEGFMEQLSSAGYLKPKLISMPDHISKELGINIAEARTFLLDYKFKLSVKTKDERDIITERVKTLWQRRKKKNE
jgi:hypothetical protein